MCAIEFNAFNPRNAMCTYRTHMPHWRQDEATYFVTFRLADSMPRHLLHSWKTELASWLKANGIKYDPRTWREDIRKLPENIRNSYLRLAGARLDAHLDKGAGSCLLKNRQNAQQIADALRHFDGDRLQCGDFVIMPNHVHWLVKPSPGNNLETLLYSIKRFSAARINRLSGRTGRLWQRGNYDHIVRDAAELVHYRGYIERNPAGAALSAGKTLIHKADWLLPFP